MLELCKLVAFFLYLRPKLRKEKAKGVQVFRQQLMSFGMDRYAIDILSEEYCSLDKLDLSV